MSDVLSKQVYSPPTNGFAWSSKALRDEDSHFSLRNEVMLENGAAVLGWLLRWRNKSNQIKSLDISFSTIHGCGMTALGGSLCHLTSLEFLSLRAVGLWDGNHDGRKVLSTGDVNDGINVLCTALRNLHALRALDIALNGIRAESSRYILSALCALSALEYLNLNRNEMGFEFKCREEDPLCCGAGFLQVCGFDESGRLSTEFANAVCQFPKLSYLFIAGNRFKEQQIRKILKQKNLHIFGDWLLLRILNFLIVVFVLAVPGLLCWRSIELVFATFTPDKYRIPSTSILVGNVTVSGSFLNFCTNVQVSDSTSVMTADCTTTINGIKQPTYTYEITTSGCASFNFCGGFYATPTQWVPLELVCDNTGPNDPVMLYFQRRILIKIICIFILLSGILLIIFYALFFELFLRNLVIKKLLARPPLQLALQNEKHMTQHCLDFLMMSRSKRYKFSRWDFFFRQWNICFYSWTVIILLAVMVALSISFGKQDLACWKGNFDICNCEYPGGFGGYGTLT